MQLIESKFKDVLLFVDLLQKDNRGYFQRLFCKKTYNKILCDREILQINHSLTVNKGNIRGMHYQLPPNSELKIIRCTRGSVFDVCVDLRSQSDTFLNWMGVELSLENNNVIVIPEGFAHGFQALEDNSELVYLHTNFYAPESERTLRYDDPHINIKWPIKPNLVSQKDLNHPFINKDFKGIFL
jgi:dTDP-4-dehydrorhamnose 3,5-epimerase